MGPVLMVLGTASSVGKSTLVAGLCRLFARRGVRVAPFKAQNMSNNAAVCPSGGEIGRAQYAQAMAAGIEPTVQMNPILLKPQLGKSQLVVLGKRESTLDAQGYYQRSVGDLWPVVVDALDSLRRDYDLVIAEGAGSPAEINLRQRDIVNMRVARHAAADVLLVADIDKGGAFASLLGTWEWLEPDERRLVRGFVLNKFRGDARLLEPAPAMLEERTGVPVLGVVPYLSELSLADEDSASLVTRPSSVGAIVEIAVVRLPHIANFDEFGLLAAEPGVMLRYVATPEELRAPDLVVVPGSKATIPDLMWLHASGLAGRIRWLVEHRTPVLGICGGMQMLGLAVSDPLGIESAEPESRGIGLLPLRTVLTDTKRLTRVSVKFESGLPCIWESLGGVQADGYEIHLGTSETYSFSGDDQPSPALRATSPRGRGDASAALLKLLDLGGVVTPDGLVAGTYVHGLFEHPEPRAALLGGLAARRGFTEWRPHEPDARNPYDLIADAIEANLRGLPLLVGGLT
jgi:adenosylcobyric acid synthase